MCGDCAAIVDGQRAPPPSSPSYVCAFCGARRGAAIDVGGVYLCEVCGSADVWAEPFSDVAAALSSCSFCGEVPRGIGVIVGPGLSLCSRCVEHAHAMRSAGRCDPPRPTPPSCSFDGKGFRELRELFVAGDLAFCDECVGFIDTILPANDMRARLRITRGSEMERCASCGGAGDLRRPEHGPALCTGRLRAGKPVGMWCLACDQGLDASEPVAQVRGGLLCASCTDAEVHLAKLTAFVGRR